MRDHVTGNSRFGGSNLDIFDGCKEKGAGKQRSGHFRIRNQSTVHTERLGRLPSDGSLAHDDGTRGRHSGGACGECARNIAFPRGLSPSCINFRAVGGLIFVNGAELADVVVTSVAAGGRPGLPWCLRARPSSGYQSINRCVGRQLGSVRARVFPTFRSPVHNLSLAHAPLRPCSLVLGI